MRYFQAMGRGLSAVSARFMPDPMIFALALSIVVLVLGVAINQSGPKDMHVAW
jgi:short subunit fatty acids transporter